MEKESKNQKPSISEKEESDRLNLFLENCQYFPMAGSKNDGRTGNIEYVKKIKNLAQKYGRDGDITPFFKRYYFIWNNFPFSKENPQVNMSLEKIKGLQDLREKKIKENPEKYSPLNIPGDIIFYDHYINHPKCPDKKSLSSFIILDKRSCSSIESSIEDLTLKKMEDLLEVFLDNYRGYKKRKNEHYIRNIAETIFDVTKGEYFCLSRITYTGAIKWNKSDKWLIEHCLGRTNVSKEFIQFVDLIGEKNLSREILLNFLKKKAFTIWIEKTMNNDGDNIHTKVNSELMEFQSDGKISFVDYNYVLMKNGYKPLDINLKEYFNRRTQY
jgi:hypothetical protein